MTYTIIETARGAVEWEIPDVTRPGGCATVAWCAGGCDTTPGAERAQHCREVASAFAGDDQILAVDVLQVKAVTPWRDSGTVFYPNTDQAPEVRVCQYSPGGKIAGGLTLSVPDAVTLVGTLRATGADGLADAIQNAVDLAAAIAVGARP